MDISGDMHLDVVSSPNGYQSDVLAVLYSARCEQFLFRRRLLAPN